MVALVKDRVGSDQDFPNQKGLIRNFRQNVSHHPSDQRLIMTDFPNQNRLAYHINVCNITTNEQIMNP